MNLTENEDMKKLYIFLIVGLNLVNIQINAQYTRLFDLNGVNGSYPMGSLVLAGGALYGTAYFGGAYNNGYIFRINTDGSGFRPIHDFQVTDGAYPQGSLIISDDILYGMTTSGGANNKGCIYKIDTTGNNFADIFDFNGSNGRCPHGALLLLDDTLFGMTYYGGLNDLGCIFKVKTDGTGYHRLFDFNDDNGSNPCGSLVFSEEVLYGMTPFGGLNDAGCIFSVNTDGSNYLKLLDFNEYDHGSYPYGSLILSGDSLLGMTSSGGNENAGCIFSIHKDGTGYKQIWYFTDLQNAGTNPYGSLTIAGNLLYGMTLYGGVYHRGTIFQVAIDSREYSTLWSFNTLDGYHPYGDITVRGDSLFGITNEGGSFDAGVVFRYVKNIALQTSNINFLFIGTTMVNIMWTKGSGEKRVVFIKEGEEELVVPSNNITYTASSDWNTKGSELESSGYYCVYNDTGNFVSVVNLTPGTKYTVQAFEYNGNEGSEQYQLDEGTGNPATFQTESVNAIQDNGEPIFRMFSDGNDIYALINRYDVAAQLAVYNLSGICLVKSNYLLEGQNKITCNYLPGIYVVKLILNNRVHTERVIILK